jgi:hypothetical protein
MQIRVISRIGLALGAMGFMDASLSAVPLVWAQQPGRSPEMPSQDFVTMMIPHHQGAIDMARIESMGRTLCSVAWPAESSQLRREKFVRCGTLSVADLADRLPSHDCRCNVISRSNGFSSRTAAARMRKCGLPGVENRLRLGRARSLKGC